mmetsp:Transcript_24441/g.42809  ORF Transcript_24441/g.42809 Transcript_24441/m.42809 type:complete len:92 (+) Transcript_24441:59-334(+)
MRRLKSRVLYYYCPVSRLRHLLATLSNQYANRPQTMSHPTQRHLQQTRRQQQIAPDMNTKMANKKIRKLGIMLKLVGSLRRTHGTVLPTSQ